MAVVLLIATTGFSMNKHYCMGNLKSMQVYFSDHHDHADDACGDMGRMMGCCDDEHTQWKVEDLNKQSDENLFVAVDFAFEAALITPPEYIHLSEEPVVPAIPDYSVPDPPEDLLVSHQVFRL